jgi:hypothetical protein
MKKLNEKLAVLDELIRKVSSYLDPTDRFEYLSNDTEVESLQKKYPNCFIPVNRKVGPPYFFAICNRIGIIDPRVLDISIKVVNKFIESPTDQYDINDLQKILNNLQRLKTRYDQDIPKPYDQAAKKGIVTKMFNNIKGYIDRGSNEN